jgi:hypothetical protein
MARRIEISCFLKTAFSAQKRYALCLILVSGDAVRNQVTNADDKSDIIQEKFMKRPIYIYLNWSFYRDTLWKKP